MFRDVMAAALLLVVSFAVIGGTAAREKTQAAKQKDAPAAARPATVETPAPAHEVNNPAAAPTGADSAPPVEPKQAATPLDPKAAEINASIEAGLAASTKGPATISLIDQGSITIPANEAFIPKPEGMRFLRALGQSPGPEVVGLVMGLGDDVEWVAVIRYTNEGYIRDDDAKNLSADDLLSNLREGAEEENKDREARGFRPVEVLGWIEKPIYDSSQHRLVWSLLSSAKGDASNPVKGVNYNTYALGREGYFSLSMLTTSAKVEQYKPTAKALLANLAYKSGKRYEDFNSSTDQVAAYGLAALVGGVAAKKLGLLGLGAAFFAKFAKVIVLAVAGLGVGIMKFFNRGQKT
ncbi:DUF2167 domain-containing protein [Methylocystis hirsuta]|nr:DUF2167 domain-containing protein [Methylocystis hirsuta]